MGYHNNMNIKRIKLAERESSGRFLIVKVTEHFGKKENAKEDITLSERCYKEKSGINY